MAALPMDPPKGKSAMSSAVRSNSTGEVALQRKRRPARGTMRAINFVGIYELDPIVRIQQAETGLPAADVGATARSMNVPYRRVIDILEYSKATITRKVANGLRLTRDESERLLGLQKLVGQVEKMVRLCGDSHGFDAPVWVERFLATPCPAFGGIKPEDLMPSSEGRQLVESCVARMSADV